MTEESKVADQAKQKKTEEPEKDSREESNSSQAPKTVLDELRKKAEERDEYLKLLQQTQAEFQNFQKRNQKEREQLRKFITSDILVDMFPVLDNLERATTAAQKAGESGSLVQGVQMVLKQFLELLQQYGVLKIEAEGQPFDPTLHEAITQGPSDLPQNTVIAVVETGYQMEGRVLRPAKVVVSAGPPNPGTESQN